MAPVGTGFSQGFGAVRARARRGQVGDWTKVGHLNPFLTGINSVPQSKQSSVLAVTDPGDNVVISVTINGVVVSFDTGSGLDQDEIGIGIQGAIDAEPLVRAAVLPVYNPTTNNLTLTAKLPGQVFTVTDQTTGLGAPVTTAAVVAEDIPFGRAVVYTGQSSDGTERLVGLAKTTRFTPQVQTTTVVNGTAGTRTARVYEIRGSERILLAEAPYVGSATEATEATNIANALNTALPTGTVVFTTSTADVIGTAEVAGLEFDVETEYVTAGDHTKANTTGPDETTSLHRSLDGISLYSPNDEAAQIGGSEGRYVANRGIRYATAGELWVANEETTQPGFLDTVYVELADGDDSGKFYRTDSATRLALGRALAQWVRSATPATDGLSVVHINTGRVP